MTKKKTKKQHSNQKNKKILNQEKKVTQKLKNPIQEAKDPIQEKKDYLIFLLKKYGEYDKNINRENLPSEKIDEIYEVLSIRDEEKRNEKINEFKQKEIQKMKELRKRAEHLLQRIRKLSIKMKEAKSSIKDNQDISDLENQISQMER